MNKQKEKKDATTSMYYLRQPVILGNLIVITLVWLTCSFDFYLIQFLVNTFD